MYAVILILFLDEQYYRHSREGRFRISAFRKRSAEGRGAKVKGQLFVNTCKYKYRQRYQGFKYFSSVSLKFSLPKQSLAT